MAESSQNGLLVTSNFSFSHSVFKRLVLQTRENQGLFGKGLSWRRSHLQVPDVPNVIQPVYRYMFVCLFFVYLLSLPVAHLSDAPIRQLVVMGDSARIQDKTTESSVLERARCKELSHRT